MMHLKQINKTTILSILFFVFTIFCMPAVFADVADECEEQVPTVNIQFNVSYPRFDDIDNLAIQDKINNDVKAYTHECLKEMQGYLFEDFPAGVDIHPVMHLRSEDRLSFHMFYWMYTGGAHGNVIINTFNYDLKTGKKLSFKDVSKASLKQINKAIFAQAEGFYDDFKGIKEYPETFYLDDDGSVVIVFQPYEIAPYVRGVIEVRI
ncbi:DUF3298 and DUF4163 domain-containing protein [Selenomonadales bacterium OttesenSCG-928-I06]|nr:DUF3298 and DUF4163 domain-containing protein [Selenomonadales bacterium OttesenSCG-928-I06]